MSEALSSTIIVGIDTHKFIHAAVAITELGARLGQMTVPVSAKGYRTHPRLDRVDLADPAQRFEAGGMAGCPSRFRPVFALSLKGGD